MTQDQSQKYECLSRCQATANQYHSDWATFTPFSTPWNEVLFFKTLIDGLIAEQSSPFTAAGQKALARFTLKVQMNKAITALEWLAGKNHDATLRKAAHISPSDIDKAKEPALIGLATKRLELVQTAGTSLVPVNYTAGDATHLDNAITAFTAAIGTPGAQHDAHEKNTAQLDAQFVLAFQKLKDECDPAVATMVATSPDFAEQWEVSREIGQSTAHRTRALEVHVLDSVSHTPLANATAIFTGGATNPKPKRSSAGGAFFVQNMLPGNYTMTISIAGYTEQALPVAVVAGQRAVMTVMMVPMG